MQMGMGAFVSDLQHPNNLNLGARSDLLHPKLPPTSKPTDTLFLTQRVKEAQSLRSHHYTESLYLMEDLKDKQLQINILQQQLTAPSPVLPLTSPQVWQPPSQVQPEN